MLLTIGMISTTQKVGTTRRETHITNLRASTNQEVGTSKTKDMEILATEKLNMPLRSNPTTLKKVVKPMKANTSQNRHTLHRSRSIELKELSLKEFNLRNI